MHRALRNLLALTLSAAPLAAQQGSGAGNGPPAMPLPAASPTLPRYDLARPARVLRLPAELAEVSGLAVLPDGRLLAHHDESPTLYVLDPLSGSALRTIQLAGRARRGDFEDLLLLADTAFLAESDGTLFRIVLPPPGARARFTRMQGLSGGQCEVESLGLDLGREGLIVLCKRVRGPRDGAALLGYRWSFRTERYERQPSLRVPWQAFGPVEGRQPFAASGMTRSASGESWLVLDGPNRRIAEVDTAGRVLALAHLPPALLPQAEGVAVGADGTLYIASEGRGGPATLVVYFPRRQPAP